MLQCQTHKAFLDEYKALGCPIEIMDIAYPLYDEESILRLYKGLEVRSMHSAFIDVNFASNDPEIRSISQKRVEWSIITGKKLGAENAVVHTCFYPVLNNAGLYTIWCEAAAEFLNKLVNRYDINIMVENTLDISPDVLKELMSIVGNERINVCLDVGHAFLSKKSVAEWIEALQGRIKYMHINDNDGYVDEHLAVGDGKIDWQELNRLLNKYSLDPITTIEVYSPESFKKSLKYWNDIKECVK